MAEEFIPQVLSFKPIPVERIWGGSRLRDLFGKDFDPGKQIGESWEICDRGDLVSVVDTGTYKGKSLRELLNLWPVEILGQSMTHHRKAFPLLVKFLDTSETLSIQVHPDDVCAKKFGDEVKAEAWYVMGAEKNAKVPQSGKIICGFKKDTSASEFLDTLKSGSLAKLLLEHEARTGELFYLPPGTVHALGAGLLVAEIQQNSDSTYRVYDWDRVGQDGKARELHLDKALASMRYRRLANGPTQLGWNPENCGPFRISAWDFEAGEEKRITDISHFQIIMCVKGLAGFFSSNFQVKLKEGGTLLVPAALKDYKICSESKALRVLCIEQTV